MSSPPQSPLSSPHYVVLGGGIAGVCCIEEILRVDQSCRATLISGSSSIKGIRNYVKLTDALSTFDVEEIDLATFEASSGGRLRVIEGVVDRVDPEGKVIHFSADAAKLPKYTPISYDRLCICTGATPRLLLQHPLVVGVRDTHSVVELGKMLSRARRILIVGNGGIALGLINEVRQPA